jgi:hypothetical protein
MQLRTKPSLILRRNAARFLAGVASCLPLARVVSLPAHVRRISVINLYPTIAYFRFGLPAILVEHDQFCFLRWHMAIDAIVGGTVGFGEHDGLRLVTAQTPLGKFRSIVLHQVHIVTRKAGHGRLLETAAALQHLYLAAMDIQGRGRVGGRQPEIFLEGLSGRVGKLRLHRCSRSRMAPRAQIHLPLAGELSGIEYAKVARRSCFRRKSLRVLCSAPVALFTGNTHNESCLAVMVCGRRSRLEISCVALQAAWNHRTSKICYAIVVSRAVYPTQLSPKRNRQLKKIVSLPKKISLPFSAGADYKVESFAARSNERILALNRSLEKSSALSIHSKRQIRI